MGARLENELAIKSKVETKLKEYPEYLYEWYLSLCASDTTAASIQDYTNKIMLFLKYIDCNTKYINPQDITYNTTNKYFISKKTQNKKGKVIYSSDSYMQSLWSCLNNFFDFMKSRGYVNENYMTEIKRPKNTDLNKINRNRILLTEEDFNEILNVTKNGCGSNKAIIAQNKIKNRDICIMLLFMCTGMRREALREIDITDINWKDKTLIVTDKGDKEQVYYLNDMIINNLREWIENKNKFCNNNILFVTETGQRMSSNAIYKLVVKYCDAALGEHVSPHKLRSGFCSIMYKKTKDIEFVRRAVGHSNIATTQRYIVTKNIERKKSAELMSNILS